MDQEIEDLIAPRHHKAEIVFGLVAFAFGLFLLSQLGSELTWKSGLPFVKQPGFFATTSIFGMLLFGAFELYFAWSRRLAVAEQSIVGEMTNWAKAIEYAFWFMVYVSIVPYAGYITTTLVFCFLLTLRLGYRNRKVLLASLLVGFATVVIFKGMLSVKIPGGAVYEMLPTVLRNFMILYL